MVGRKVRVSGLEECAHPAFAEDSGLFSEVKEAISGSLVS